MHEKDSDSTSGEQPAVCDQSTSTSVAEGHDAIDQKKWSWKRRAATGAVVFGLGAGAGALALVSLSDFFDGDVKSERADAVLASLELPELTPVDNAESVEVPCPNKSKQSSITFKFNGGINNQRPTLFMNETTGVMSADGANIAETSKEKPYLLSDSNERHEMLSRVAKLCLVVTNGQHTSSNNIAQNPSPTTTVVR